MSHVFVFVCLVVTCCDGVICRMRFGYRAHPVYTFGECETHLIRKIKGGTWDDVADCASN